MVNKLAPGVELGLHAVAAIKIELEAYSRVGCGAGVALGTNVIGKDFENKDNSRLKISEFGPHTHFTRALFTYQLKKGQFWHPS